MGFLSKIFGFIGGMSNFTNTTCITWLYDEPECPKSMIEE